MISDGKVFEQLVFTIKDKCVGCNNCLRGCPAFGANKAYINDDSNNEIQVIFENCINCGHCIEQCTYGARDYHDDTERFFKDLESGKPISILIAPSIRTNFIDGLYENLFGYLKSLGVKNIIDVSLGADITIWGYLKYLSTAEKCGKISQPCPAVVNYIESRLPELIPELVPVHSPLICTAAYAKKYLNITDSLAFISPCIAKHDEINSPNTDGLVEYNITYKKLKEYIERQNADITAFDKIQFGISSKGLGLLFPKQGGLRENVELLTGGTIWIKQIEGEKDAYPYLEDLVQQSKESYLPHLIDVLNCRQGCNFGNGACNQCNINEAEYQLFEAKGAGPYRVDELKDLFKQFDAQLDPNDFKRNYSKRAISLSPATPGHIEESYIKLMKFEDADRHIDCHSCGFSSCYEMAKAICCGLNTEQNCIIYIRKKLLEEHQQLESANRAKSDFLSNMSHEIRTPMNAVIGMSEILMREQMSAKQLEYVNDIYTSSRALLAIINDILDMSKIESGKLELIPVHYSFPTLLDNITSIFVHVAMNKGLDFICEKGDNLPEALYGDDLRLRQVLTNICGNAIKFTRQGYIKLKATATQNDIIFEIEDTGQGIRNEDIPKLFSAFTQVNVKKNRSVTGTGLGLAISKSFIDLMGGDITIKSEYGHGTTFTVTIPRVDGDLTKIINEAVNTQQISAPSAKVLLVDDNSFNLKVACGLLSMSDITPDTAESGMEAIEKIHKTDYDLVFMDHMMPDMDGIETTARIRELGGKYKSLCIVALTANALSGAKEMFLQNGFNGFISKPIEINTLIAILKEFLPSHKVSQKQDSAEGCTEEDDRIFKKLSALEELNTEIGLSRMSGVRDMYIKSAQMLAKKLAADIDKLGSLMDDGDMAGFVISIHAMKSSLATIGAMQLAGLAQDLEMGEKAGLIGNSEIIFPVFIERTMALCNELDKIFPDAAEEGNVLQKGDSDKLKELLEQASAAADNFDSDTCLEIFDNALHYDFGKSINNLFVKAKDAASAFDIDAISETLEEIQNIKGEL